MIKLLLQLGPKKVAITQRKENLLNDLNNLYLPPLILPKFLLQSSDIRDKVIISFSDGSIYYENSNPILQHINISISSKERVSLSGDNGSGKTSLIKTFLGDKKLFKTGEWIIPKIQDIGYLDQQYANLSNDKTVIDNLSDLQPSWPDEKIRSHLNDFLF